MIAMGLSPGMGLGKMAQSGETGSDSGSLSADPAAIGSFVATFLSQQMAPDAAGEAAAELAIPAGGRMDLPDLRQTIAATELLPLTPPETPGAQPLVTDAAADPALDLTGLTAGHADSDPALSAVQGALSAGLLREGGAVREPSGGGIGPVVLGTALNGAALQTGQARSPDDAALEQQLQSALAKLTVDSDGAIEETAMKSAFLAESVSAGRGGADALLALRAALGAGESTNGAESVARNAEAIVPPGVQKMGEALQMTQVYTGKPAALPMQDPGLFAERLNQQVAVMMSHNAQQARIAVSPPELGPVEIQVSVNGDEATVQLAATHPATRQALEDALPRLRAAFLESGINLGDAGVFTQLPDRQAHNGQGHGAVAGNGTHIPDAEQAAPPPLAVVRLGLVDDFA